MGQADSMTKKYRRYEDHPGVIVGHQRHCTEARITPEAFAGQYWPLIAIECPPGSVVVVRHVGNVLRPVIVEVPSRLVHEGTSSESD